MASALVALLAFVAVSAEARSPFDGKWVADLDTQSGLATDDYLVADGQYSCRSCQPPRSYPADGRPHAIPGDPETQLEAVTIAGPRTIVTHIVSSALDRTTTMTVSSDDRTATYVSLDHRPGIKHPLRTEYLARRSSPAPAGAHRVSGTWQGIRYVVVPVEARTTELRVRGPTLTYRTPFGTTFRARLGGPSAPITTVAQGDYRAAVRLVDRRQIEEMVLLDGKPVTKRTFTLALGGRSMEIATTNLGNGTTYRVIARRSR